MIDAFICDAVRTPFGRYGGALSGVRTDDLGAHADRRAHAAQPRRRLGGARRRGLRLRQPGGRGQPQRRRAWRCCSRACRSTCPAATVNRLCGSGMEAVGQVARAIRCGRIADRHRRRRREHVARALRDAQGRRRLLARQRGLRHHHRLALREPEDEGEVRRRPDARDRRERRRRLQGLARRPGRLRAALAAARARRAGARRARRGDRRR